MYSDRLRQSSPLALHYNTKVYITPAGVNFYQCRIKENSVFADPHEGYFKTYSGWHDPSFDVGVINKNNYESAKGSFISALDKVGISIPLEDPYSNGLFVWNIPYLYDVNNNSSWQQFKTVTQTMSLYQENGLWTFRVQKAGADEKVP